MKRSYARLFPLLSILIMLPALVATLPAKAYLGEVLDQSHDPLWLVSSQPGIPNSLFQSFKPALPFLTSVDLRLLNDNKTSAYVMEVRIRQGAFSGPILGSTQFTVPPDHNETNTILVHVTFPYPIRVTPGSTYLIDLFWSSEANAYRVWWTRGADTYPDGMALGSAGTPLEVSDFNFQTWGTFSVGGDVIPAPAGSYASLLLAATVATATVVLGYRLSKKKPSSIFSSS